MQDAIDAAEVDESAVARDVFHRALENHSLFEHLENFLFQRIALFFQQRAPRDNDVAARAVEFENREAIGGADKTIQIAARTNIDVRAGKNRRHADIDLKTAFHFADDVALDGALFVESFFQLFPNLEILGALAGQHDAAAFRFPKNRNKHRRRRRP